MINPTPMTEEEITINLLLIEAIEKVSQIPPVLKKLDELNSKENRLHVGRAVYELQEFRKSLSRLWPESLADQMEEVEENYEQYLERSKLIEKAVTCEKSGMFEEADKLYEKIRNEFDSIYFKTLAEAGLFRVRGQHRA